MKTFYLFISLMAATISYGQTISAKLNAAVKTLERDNQFKHAILSLYVVESKTGKVILDKNSQTGLAAASCQKIVTSASAFEILGKDFRYKTELAIDGEVVENNLKGNLYIIGYGDPSLGSWRWEKTQENAILNSFLQAVNAKGIKHIQGNVFCFDANWESNIIPDGWIWEDIGNYYGAGASGFNWRENQYKVVLCSGNKVGDDVVFKSVYPVLNRIGFHVEAKSGEKNSGDNAYIYLAPFSTDAFIRGTIPSGSDSFTLSGSIPNPGYQFAYFFAEKLRENNIIVPYSSSYNELGLYKKDFPIKGVKTFYAGLSPTFDSINYWFLKKSINLYGEAFIKTIAYEKTKFGSTDSGIAIIKDFWSKKGIEKSALNILDGSGLSPANRITTNALVTVLQYAKQQKWFPSFYNALPEMNGIKMKDGYISGVRSYTGYTKSKSGNEYTFSFIVNNFDGNAATVREKMWQVLDILK
jgi:D-alanyl-D-alanine carboxypeptidase/D-alanyl-D-alanine-endopeptidase (penicillin-binding protein 4)